MTDDLESKIDKEFGRPHHYEQEFFEAEGTSYLIAKNSQTGPFAVYSSDGRDDWFGGPHQEIWGNRKIDGIDLLVVLLKSFDETDYVSFFTREGETLFGKKSVSNGDFVEVEGETFLKAAAKKYDPEKLYSKDGFRFKDEEEIRNSTHYEKKESRYIYDLLKEIIMEKENRVDSIPISIIEKILNYNLVENAKKFLGKDFQSLLADFAGTRMFENDSRIDYFWGIVDKFSNSGENMISEDDYYSILGIVSDPNFAFISLVGKVDLALDYQSNLPPEERESIDVIRRYEYFDVPGFKILKKIGRGAIKKAYLAKSDFHDGEMVLLQIDPNSKGFVHYQNIYKGKSKDELVHFIIENECSSSKITLDLEDSRYVTKMMHPLKGKIFDKSFIFIPTKKYEFTLEDLMQKGPIPLEKAYKYMYQMCYALNNCHKAGIVHKDLKPDNIGIDANDNIVVSDFGCISMFSYGDDCRYQYPADLKPPELAYPDEYWREKGVKSQSDLFTPEANIWTLGGIAYFMFSGDTIVERPKERAKIDTPEWHRQNQAMYDMIQDPHYINDKIQALHSGGSSLGYLGITSFIDMALKREPSVRKEAVDDIIPLTEKYLKNELLI